MEAFVYEVSSQTAFAKRLFKDRSATLYKSYNCQCQKASSSIFKISLVAIDSDTQTNYPNANYLQ